MHAHPRMAMALNLWVAKIVQKLTFQLKNLIIPKYQLVRFIVRIDGPQAHDNIWQNLSGFDRFLLFWPYFNGNKERSKAIWRGMLQKEFRRPVPPLLAGLTPEKSALRLQGKPRDCGKGPFQVGNHIRRCLNKRTGSLSYKLCFFFVSKFVSMVRMMSIIRSDPMASKSAKPFLYISSAWSNRFRMR